MLTFNNNLANTKEIQENFILIRKSYLKICVNNSCAASLLNYFEFRYNSKLKILKKNINLLNQDLNLDTKNFINELLVWNTLEELQELLMIFGKRTIQKAIKVLVDLNLISIHRNPNPKYAFDNTKYFLFHPVELRKKISNLEESNKQISELQINTEPSVINEIAGENKSAKPSVSCDIDRPIKSALSSALKEPCGVVKNAQVVKSNLPQQYTKNTTNITSKITSKNTTKITTKNTSNSESEKFFALFWQSWTKITGKAIKKHNCEKLFLAIYLANKKILPTLLFALQQQQQARELQEKYSLFVANWPNPDTWLREQRWQDEVIVNEKLIQQQAYSQNKHNPQAKNNLIQQQRKEYLDETYSRYFAENGIETCREAAFNALDDMYNKKFNI